MASEATQRGSTSSPPTDSELVALIARGEATAFAALYDRYSSILLGLLIRILRNHTEAEDVLQEAFLTVWQRAADYREERGQVFTWLVTIARNRAIDRLRFNDTRDRITQVAVRELNFTTASTERIAIERERCEIIENVLAEMPEKQRESLRLSFFEGLSQSEIAKRLGVPLGTIKTRMRAGLRKLHETLRERLRDMS